MTNQPSPGEFDKLDEAVRAFQRMPVPQAPVGLPWPESESSSVSPLSPARRFYMRPAFRYALAASLLVAAVGALFWGNGSNLVLADVVKAAQKHHVVRYRVKQTTDAKQMGSASLESVAYADLRAPRFRSESGGLTLNRTVKMAHYFVLDGVKDRTLGVLTETVVPENVNDETPSFLKEMLASGKWPRKEATLSKYEGDFTPATDSSKRSILENLRELEQHEDAAPIDDELDGKRVLKYRLEDGKTTTTLWVDPKTELPVRLEREIVDHTPEIARNQWTLSDFEWDPKLEDVKDIEALFDTTPPAGYQVTDRTKS